MTQEEAFINGELLRTCREARDLGVSDLATRACMSVKQIRQLEEGGMSAFYSPAVKMTSAKKVGALLGLSAEEVFAKDAEPLTESETQDSVVVIANPKVASVEISPVEIDPVSQDVTLKNVDESISSSSLFPSQVSPASVAGEPKSKTSLLVIAGLFAAALGVAAYMQPDEEPAIEAAPPLQVLPADVSDPVSAASAADVPASSADVVALTASASASAVNSQKPVLAASSATSAPRVAASVSNSVVPAISRASTAATPVASTPSKAP